MTYLACDDVSTLVSLHQNNATKQREYAMLTIGIVKWSTSLYIELSTSFASNFCASCM